MRNSTLIRFVVLVALSMGSGPFVSADEVRSNSAAVRSNGAHISTGSGMQLHSSVGGFRPGTFRAAPAVGDGEGDVSHSSGANAALGLDALPSRYSLRPNRPNPFNPATTIKFDLPESRHVKLAVFDIKGRHVATLLDRRFEAGRHATTWRADHLPTGVYVFRLEAGDFVQNRRMVLIK